MALEGAAITCSANQNDTLALKFYGDNLGLAFQIKDDLMDYSQAIEDKKNFVTLIGKKETEELLKVSTSTIKRMLKKGLIKANKVGGQYRILGKEIFRLVSPDVEKKAVKAYLRLKKKVVDAINPW